MIDYAAMRLRAGLKMDCRCSCGSNVFSCSPLMVTNGDGRSLSSNQANTVNCSVYIMMCVCGRRYLMSGEPAEHELTLIPLDSDEAKAFLAPILPDFGVPGKDVEVHVER